MWVGWKAAQLSLHSGVHKLPKTACKMSRLCGRALITCRRCSLELKPTLVSCPITCMALACLCHASLHFVSICISVCLGLSECMHASVCSSMYLSVCGLSAVSAVRLLVFWLLLMQLPQALTRCQTHCPDSVCTLSDMHCLCCRLFAAVCGGVPARRAREKHVQCD